MRLEMRRRHVLFVKAVALLYAMLLTPLLAGQQFAQPAVVPTGNWPAAVYTADVNGDGSPDLVYVDHGAAANQTSTTHLLLGDGKGGFQPGPQFLTTGSSLAFGDFQNRGSRQIASIVTYRTVGGGGCTYTIQFNFVLLPAGTSGGATSLCALGFAPPVIGHLAGAHLHSAGDDLLFTDAANNLLYDVQPSLPNTATEQPLQDGAGPLTFADLNNDGRLDVVVNGQSGAGVANVFLNSGAGLLPAGRYTGSGAIHSLLVQDVTLDGRPDLISEGLNGRIDVYPGNGDGTFATTSIGGTGPLDGLTGNGGHLIAIADLNRDGQLDALTATPAGVSTLFGAGTSYLKLGGIYNAGPGHSSYAVADFNGDGNLDLAVDSPEGIAILYGKADGSFQTSLAYAAGQPALSAALAAFTTSGKLDAVVSTAATQAQFLRGAGDGTFAASPAPTTNKTGTPGLWSTLLAADFDADGHLDLLLTADGSDANLPGVGVASGIYLQRGDGSGNFADPVPATAPVQFTYPDSSACSPPFDHFPGQFFGTSALGDFNADGIADFASRDDAAYRILRGNNGTSVASYTLAPTLFWSGVDGTGNTVDCNPHAHDLVASADLNHDGYADLIFQGSQGNSGALLLYLTSGPGSLALAGDLSLDGSLTTPGQLTAPRISSTFGGTSATFNQPYFPGAIATADLDRDGNTDILVTYAALAADPANPVPATPNYLYLWYGSGNGKYLTSAKHPVNPVRTQLSRNYYQVAVADLDGDGIPDLILSDGYLISYQLGVGDGSFGAEHHLLAGAGLNTIATADLRGTGAQDLVVANGGAALASPVVNHEALAADPVVNTGGITVLLNAVTAKALVSNLSASPEPSVYFSPFTITATLTGSPQPTGTVLFSVDGTPIGSVTSSTGTFQLIAPNTYLPGSHSLTATYSGDANYPASTLTPGTHLISRSPTTVTLLPTTPLTVYYGQGIDGVFALYVVDPSHPADGNYTLLDNGAPVAICTNIPYNQQCPYGNPVLLDAGSHVFQIEYLGDAVNAPGISINYPYTILPDLTTLLLASSKNPATLGDAITFTATATGNIVAPNGAVNFLDGGVLIGSGTLGSGSPGMLSTATFITSALAVGTHAITAVYAGNADFNAAASAVLSQVIQPVSPGTQASLTTLTSNLNPSAPQQLITFTANVQVPGAFVTIASGTVTFLDGGATIGSATLNQFGVATLQTAALATGTHTITAAYAGAVSTTVPSILPSTSNPVVQVVTIPIASAPPGFVMTVTPGSLTLGVGRTGIIAVNIVAVSGFNQPVTLTCSGLAPETSCVFLPNATTPAGGGTVTLQLLTNAPRDCNTNTPYFLGSTGQPPWPVGSGIAAALLVLVLRRRRLRLTKSLLLLAAAAALTGISGCGHCTDLGTKPGNYSFQITAVAQGSPVVETRTVTIPLTMTVP